MVLKLWLPALLLAAFIDPQAAAAGTSICNDTGELHNLAIALRTSNGWRSEGWVSLQPDQCLTPAPEDYSARFFYFRAESAGRSFLDDSIRFCTASGSFRIEGGKNCLSRGYAEEAFAKAQSDAGSRRILLSTRSRRKRGAAPSAALQNGNAFSADAIFQGCSRVTARARVACRFVASGMEVRSEGHHGFSNPQFAVLQGMASGTPLLINGVLTNSLGRYGELTLHSVTPRDPSRFDRLLLKLQGRWRSMQDPEDQFAVTGSVRQATYYGRRMGEEFVSVQDRCAGVQSRGDYLMTWDREGGTSLCYRIKSLTADELVLEYLPRGTELRYRRQQ